MSKSQERGSQRIDTVAIHGGQLAEPVTGAVMPPVSFSSTYAQKSPGVHTGYEYSRTHNPTRFALERSIAALEGAAAEGDVTGGGFAFASGLAASSIVLDLLDSGDEVLCMDDLYGGTYRLMAGVRARAAGLKISFVDMTDLSALEAAVSARSKLIWAETPTNPTMKLVDLEAVARLGRERGLITACDNTFATPVLQRPLSLGFDLAVHSATKYLGGHSDVVGGLIATNDVGLAERLRFLQNAVGSGLGPMDSYLVLRGIKTLALRVQRHCENAGRVAAWLEARPEVTRVAYPGLPSHPQYDLAQRQMRLHGEPAGGGMITFWLDGGLEASRRFLEGVKMITLAESLGGVESLIEHPAIMTHASIPPEQRAKLGIDDGLCRLSVGVEHVDDIIADLEQALR